MKAYIWYHMTALGAGILLDLAVGDPHWFPHPVRLIGAYISRLERRLYPEAKAGILAAGLPDRDGCDRRCHGGGVPDSPGLRNGG